MKSLRFYLAMVVGRASFVALRILGRKATHMPGNIALKIYPSILKEFDLGKKFVAVMGTNGKTTTANLIVDFLKAQNISLVANQFGSNLEAGLVSCLLQSNTMNGKSKVDMSVFEVDERASRLIFPHIKPDVIVLTNLFRDSYERNAHVEFIGQILTNSIPQESLLILNADDLFSSQLFEKNEKKFFSLQPLMGEEGITDSIIQDVIYCPQCGANLTFEFKRYHHIGRAHCEHCGFESPKGDFVVSQISEDSLQLSENGETYHYLENNDSITNLYNELAAISTLRALGFSHEVLADFFNHLKIVESRHGEVMAGNKRVINILAKDQNPVANSRVFDYIRQQKQWGSVTIVLMNEIFSHDPGYKVENMAWIYDADFEYLNTDQIEQIYCMGNRNLEVKSRLLLAGVNEDKIHLLAPSKQLNIPVETDSIVLLYSTKNIDTMESFKAQLIKELSHEN